MAVKKITIVLLPEGSLKVRQMKIPKPLIYLSCLVIAPFLCLIGYASYDYYSVKKELPRLYALEQEYNLQKPQIPALSQKIDEIKQKLADYKKFDDKLRIMVNLETKDDNIQFVGVGGSDPIQMGPDRTLEKTKIRIMHQSLDNLDTEITIQSQRKAELCKFLENQKSMLACTPSIWPTRGWVSSSFGNRISPFTNEREFHKGVDISARMKTKIIAPANGVITSVSRTYGYGNLITISHGYGMQTVYGHLDSSLVKKGDTIKRGQEIALLGNSGRSTGPHLHYEVHFNGLPVDPFRYILN